MILLLIFYLSAVSAFPSTTCVVDHCGNCITSPVDKLCSLEIAASLENNTLTMQEAMTLCGYALCEDENITGTCNPWLVYDIYSQFCGFRDEGQNHVLEVKDVDYDDCVLYSDVYWNFMRQFDWRPNPNDNVTFCLSIPQFGRRDPPLECNNNDETNSYLYQITPPNTGNSTIYIPIVEPTKATIVICNTDNISFDGSTVNVPRWRPLPAETDLWINIPFGSNCLISDEPDQIFLPGNLTMELKHSGSKIIYLYFYDCLITDFPSSEITTADSAVSVTDTNNDVLSFLAGYTGTYYFDFCDQTNVETIYFKIFDSSQHLISISSLKYENGCIVDEFLAAGAYYITEMIPSQIFAPEKTCSTFSDIQGENCSATACEELNHRLMCAETCCNTQSETRGQLVKNTPNYAVLSWWVIVAVGGTIILGVI